MDTLLEVFGNIWIDRLINVLNLDGLILQDVVNDRIKQCLCHVAGDQINLQLVLVQAGACFINLEIAEHIMEILFSKRLRQCETRWKHLSIGYIWLVL